MITEEAYTSAGQGSMYSINELVMM